VDQIYVDEGLIACLKLVASNRDVGLVWSLYTNDIDPDRNSVFADFTLADSSWAQALVTEAQYTFDKVALHVGSIQTEAIVLTNTEGVDVTVYGEVVYDPASQVLIIARRYTEAPIVIPDGDLFVLAPIMGDASLQPTEVIDGGEF